jgi:uncharacterized protein YbcI
METNTEPIETKITRYIKEVLGRKDSEVISMRLPEKMSLIEMDNKEKWHEFKIGLRESGYII